MPACPACGKDVLDIDVRCTGCGTALGATGAHRMIGQTMLGQYELIDVLGQGGMSVVFKGRHNITDQEVALKILPPELAAHSQVKSRFLDEAKALAALDHPNIVHLYNFGQDNGHFVLAMQFVSGRTWERIIVENGRLDWAASCRICIDVLRALEYAHGRGVVHRDMKPSNVLVRADDGSATVMDFGIAKMTTSTRLTATGQTMGTVRYMSPEQVRGQEVDSRTDIYSLGATLYESLTGDTPFDGNTHFEIMTKHLTDAPQLPSRAGIELPRDVEDAVMRCLAKRADDRFASARELRKVLEAALRDSDAGLVETQKLARELVEPRKPPEPRPIEPPELTQPTPPTPQPQRIATANDLADELEPGTSTPRVVRPRRMLPWIAAGGAIAAGAAAVLALVVWRGDAASRPAGPFAGLALEPPRLVGNLTVVTDGTVSAERVATTYRTEVAALERRVNDGLAAAGEAAVVLPDRIRDVFAVPQSALCMRSAYVDREAPPADCGTVAFVNVMGAGARPQLYVVAARLDEAIRGGIAQAVCRFLPDESQLSTLICKLAETPAPLVDKRQN